ncbi:MAG: DUF523 domain-containing protein [Deltaproteobacteria bacterium]|nr:DUF523 domain-containing protein [Deltaproteobacteria bacterium]
MIIVSACLLGLCTRHDGDSAYSKEAVKALEGACPLPICPEELGGLLTPRPAAEITSGDGSSVILHKARVVDVNKADVTDNFLKGAAEALNIARRAGAVLAFLKEKSPSCGVSLICRAGGYHSGMGVTAALLKMKGIKLMGF